MYIMQINNKQRGSFLPAILKWRESTRGQGAKILVGIFTRLCMGGTFLRACIVALNKCWWMLGPKETSLQFPKQPFKRKLCAQLIFFVSMIFKRFFSLVRGCPGNFLKRDEWVVSKALHARGVRFGWGAWGNPPHPPPAHVW